jgi:hypothetical protein
MQVPVKSKFIPQIPETLVHEFLQTNAKICTELGTTDNFTLAGVVVAFRCAGWPNCCHCKSPMFGVGN